MHAATLSSKFQICIPKEIRDQMNIKVGQKFILIPEGDTIHLVPQYSIEDVKGILQGSNTTHYRDRKDRE